MHLTDTQLTEYDKLVLRISTGKRSEYLAQIDHLIEKFEKKVAEDGTYKIIRFRKAGSMIKATQLKPKGDNPPDGDVGVYFEDDPDTSTMHELLRQLVSDIYPSKPDEDVVVQPRTIGISFRTSGLEVDLVPIMAVDDDAAYGWQPSSQGGDRVLTSIPGQLKFVADHKQGDGKYRMIVRMGKQWRRHDELKQLGSYTIECIAAYVQDMYGPAESIEDGVIRLLGWISETRLQTPVTFRGQGSDPTIPGDPVVVLDPVNVDNNVTTRMTEGERDEVVKAAEAAWETLTYARRVRTEGDTIDLWREVLGRSFRVA